MEFANREMANVVLSIDGRKEVNDRMRPFRKGTGSYDLIVPNSAIREDNNGKFILIVESKPGPLNTRYIATRVDVEVLASDDTQSAISAALYGYEFVITTSTKPVEAGKQVRLAEG